MLYLYYNKTKKQISPENCFSLMVALVGQQLEDWENCQTVNSRKIRSSGKGTSSQYLKFYQEIIKKTSDGCLVIMTQFPFG